MRCAGYSQALESVSQILSPVLATVLYSSWSLSGIIFLDVIGALAAVCTLGITVIPGLPRGMDEGKVQILREARKGFKSSAPIRDAGAGAYQYPIHPGPDAHQRLVSPDEHVLF